ncbi:MAG: asparagine synthase (glutamine-hydrolyzing) [Promethearchaeota archaeon]
MCGIIGEISREISIEKFIQMRDTLIHRGPDDEGIYLNESRNVALGHRRLSIIDLSSAGKQPMKNENGTIWIIFNGEIYNFKSIREELINLNHKFSSETDTEVIIHGYEEWGIDVLQKLNGMFAFGIWDENKNIMFLARDRIGIKPLYYYKNDDKFIFASELKAIVKDKDVKRIINPEALKYYFMFGYIPSPYSIWNNIYKLPPAHYLIYQNGKFTIKKYWYLKIRDEFNEEKEIVDHIYSALSESINLRFISDVPLATLLSGGIDSSVVTSIGAKLKDDLNSFSIGFEPERFSELKYAKLVAKMYKIKNETAILSSRNISNHLEKILYYYDEPFGISGIFPTFLLMDLIPKNIKVVLSGDGGDEIFGGYLWYPKYFKFYKYRHFRTLFKLLFKFTSKILNFVKIRLIKRILNFLHDYFQKLSLNDLELFNNVSDLYFQFNDLKKLFTKDYFRIISNENFMRKYVNHGLKTIKDLQKLDIYTFLVDHVLVKVDRASMANSIEVRVPFLDHNIVEYVMSINHKLIYKNREKKYLLKKLAQSLLPSEIINKKKKGFSAPLDKLGFITKNAEILKNPLIVKDGIVNKKYIEEILNSPFRIVRHKIWLLILFELWYRKWKY